MIWLAVDPLSFSTATAAWHGKQLRLVSRETGIPIEARGIGLGLDFHDTYREWQSSSGAEEDGCVLVRLDRFVACRAKKMVPDCEAKLLQVLKILSRED